MTKAEQINALFEKPEIQQQISGLTDPEEIRKVLAENGVELTAEEMNEVLLSIGETVANLVPDSELSEDDLENVAGGFAMTISLGAGAAVFCAVAGGIIGVAAVAGLAYGAYYLYKKVKKKK